MSPETVPEAYHALLTEALLSAGLLLTRAAAECLSLDDLGLYMLDVEVKTSDRSRPKNPKWIVSKFEFVRRADHPEAATIAARCEASDGDPSRLAIRATFSGNTWWTSRSGIVAFMKRELLTVRLSDQLRILMEMMEQP